MCRRGNACVCAKVARAPGSHGDAGFTTAVGDGFHAPVVQESPTIEHGTSDTLLDTHSTEKLTHFLSAFDRLALPLLLADDILNLWAHRAERGDGFLVFIVNDLHVHVLVRAVDRNTRSFGGTRNLIARSKNTWNIVSHACFTTTISFASRVTRARRARARVDAHLGTNLTVTLLALALLGRQFRRRHHRCCHTRTSNHHRQYSIVVNQPRARD